MSSAQCELQAPVTLDTALLVTPVRINNQRFTKQRNVDCAWEVGRHDGKLQKDVSILMGAGYTAGVVAPLRLSSVKGMNGRAETKHDLFC